MDELLQKLKKNFSEAEFQELKAAYDFSAAAHEGQKRQTGEPYFIHPCAVVNILVDLGFDDVSTLVAAFLHDVLEDTPVTSDELEQKFGKEVLELVEGVTKLDKIKFVSAEDEQAENLRKMFFAMAKDYRVIIIKLADRLHNMRTLDALKPEKQIKIATQSLKIYAPLAGRLGLSFVKCELEDLAMRYLYPDDYYELVEFIKTKSKERQQFIEKICDELKAKLQELGIEGEVNGRQKHLYGIYKKMLKQGKNIEQIYDISAVRVIVNEVQDCYTVLGARFTRCGCRSRGVSRTTSQCRNPTDISRCTRRLSRSLRKLSKFRSARTKCTASRNTASRRTGNIRKEKPARPKSTTRSTGFAKLWTPSANRRTATNFWKISKATFSPTKFTFSRRKEKC